MMRRRHLAFLALALTAGATVTTARAAIVRNVVIVHGALADGSGWRRVAGLLGARGLNVTVVQQPMTSLAEDVAATRRVLDLQQGPTILVGHSYGGMVVTEAGHHPSVVGLVYVAAFQPEKGESVVSLVSGTPPAGQGIRETKDGQYLYLDPAAFYTDFAADLPRAETEFLARSQVFAAKAAFTAAAGEPAWRGKRSRAVVAIGDRSINPELERRMARRAGSTVTEIDGSHAVFASQPEKVAAVIEAAARESER
jgi:pimeloyl-ACP methyl ester carboxylesterase